ncbi:hypothetical protein FRC02_010417 [Tulasnella sp. 418]|nr:hypothetical protein FRC02_010417 [Tulasnella sp. 418]
MFSGSKPGTIAFHGILEGILDAAYSKGLEYELVNNRKLSSLMKDHLSSDILLDRRSCIRPESLPARLISRFNLVVQDLPGHMVNKDIRKLRDTVPHLRPCFSIAMKMASQNQKTNKPSKSQAHPGSKAPKKLGATPKKEAFKALGECIPTSPEEAERLMSRLLASQQRLLVCYIKLFQTADIAKWVRSGRLNSVTVPSSPSVASAIQSHDPPEQSVNTEINPTRVEEFLDYEVKDMGDWPIIICTRAFRGLGSLKDEYPNVFELAKGKIRELSHGFFSTHNQNPLAEAENGIPIFEAHLTSKLRLIYAVDCSVVRSYRGLSLPAKNEITEIQRKQHTSLAICN